MTAGDGEPTVDERVAPTSASLLSTSLRLLRGAQAGHPGAMDALFERHAPGLRRWARGRLPRWTRHLADTGDVVQEALVSVFRRLDDFEPRRHQALQAYLRQAVRNRIRDVVRTAQRSERSPSTALEALPGAESPLQDAIDAETRARYLAALDRLEPEERELVVGRVELGYSHEQLALACGKPSVDAARMAFRRALLKLAAAMTDG